VRAGQTASALKRLLRGLCVSFTRLRAVEASERGSLNLTAAFSTAREFVAAILCIVSTLSNKSGGQTQTSQLYRHYLGHEGTKRSNRRISGRWMVIFYYQGGTFAGPQGVRQVKAFCVDRVDYAQW
jgi:hypothetical protein